MVSQKHKSQSGITRFSAAVWLGVAIASAPSQALSSTDVAQADRPAAGGTVNVPALETLPRLDPQPSSATQAAPIQPSPEPNLEPSPQPSPQPSPEATPIAPSTAPSPTSPAGIPVTVPPASPAPASNTIEFGQPLPR